MASHGTFMQKGGAGAQQFDGMSSQQSYMRKVGDNDGMSSSASYMARVPEGQQMDMISQGTMMQRPGHHIDDAMSSGTFLAGHIPDDASMMSQMMKPGMFEGDMSRRSTFKKESELGNSEMMKGENPNELGDEGSEYESEL